MTYKTKKFKRNKISKIRETGISTRWLDLIFVYCSFCFLVFICSAILGISYLRYCFFEQHQHENLRIVFVSYDRNEDERIVMMMNDGIYLPLFDVNSFAAKNIQKTQRRDCFHGRLFLLMLLSMFKKFTSILDLTMVFVGSVSAVVTVLCC
jgi:hypothetical protein